MSKKNKLFKFAEMATFGNVYQNYDTQTPVVVNGAGEEVVVRGAWAAHFGNSNPITLELACGGGEYTLGLGAMYPHRNFVGVDIKGARIWKGARVALERDMGNVAFLRTQIENLAAFFERGEIAEIWITFPDPFLRLSKAQKRLTSARFIEIYRQLLPSGAPVHLKTDDDTLYAFTLETIAETGCTLLYEHPNIYSIPLPFAELAVKTYYEQMHLAAGKTIKYVRFTC